MLRLSKLPALPWRSLRAWATVLSIFLLGTLASAEPADSIYTARYVVTMNAQRDLIDDGAVAIRGQRIVGVGKRADIEKQFQAHVHINRPTPS